MKYIKLIIVLAILVFAGLFLRNTDMEQVGVSLRRVGYGFGLLIVITFVEYVLGTIGWKYCMGNEGRKLNLARLFIIRHIGETVGIINPASIVAGEATKVYLMRHYPIKRKTVITSVLLSRVLMMLTQLMVFAVAAGYMLLKYPQLHFKAAGGNVLWYIVPFVLLLFVFTKQFKYWLLRTKFGVFLAGKTNTLRGKIKNAFTELSLFFRHNKRSLYLASFYFILHWLIGSIEFWVTLQLLGLRASYLPVIFADMSVILFKSAGAFVPAQIGVEEYANKVMLGAIGISSAGVWLTVSVLRRSRQLFWLAFGTVAYFFIDGKRVDS